MAFPWLLDHRVGKAGVLNAMLGESRGIQYTKSAGEV